MGGLETYGSLAKEIQLPNASRAVGSAVADNPVAFLIPCHRVIRSTGEFGQYHWGPTRKSAMIGWEAAQIHKMAV
jgi:AraC family transcriptional regulator of adaptative response/methylated-DNA-[protein]-cysteine methyltransferase